jgi:hypothetical protein
MSVHIGEKIKKRAKELRVGPTELGRRINSSKQNVTGLFKRASVDSEMLRLVSKALEYDFFYYYKINLEPSRTSEPGMKYEKPERSPAALIKELQKMQAEHHQLQEEFQKLKAENLAHKKEIAHLENENALLKKVNDLLEAKKK